MGRQDKRLSERWRTVLSRREQGGVFRVTDDKHHEGRGEGEEVYAAVGLQSDQVVTTSQSSTVYMGSNCGGSQLDSSSPLSAQMEQHSGGSDFLSSRAGDLLHQCQWPQSPYQTGVIEGDDWFDCMERGGGLLLLGEEVEMGKKEKKEEEKACGERNLMGIASNDEEGKFKEGGNATKMAGEALGRARSYGTQQQQRLKIIKWTPEMVREKESFYVFI